MGQALYFIAMVFLFAHQDDEVFILPRIQYELSVNSDINFFYLTSGGARRCRESTNLLLSIGVKKENIHFIGDNAEIPDGQLIDNLNQAYRLLISYPVITESTTLIVPAWEGGHHDHDACAILANAIRKIIPEKRMTVLQFFLYNGQGLRWKLFKVMSPLSESQAALQFRSISLRSGIVALMALRYFPSQLSTWIGLAPGLFFQFILKRVEVLAQLNSETTECRPHFGPLLYERYGRSTYEKVSSRRLSFIKQIDSELQAFVGDD